MHYDVKGQVVVNSYFGLGRRVHSIDTLSGEVSQVSRPQEEAGQMDEWYVFPGCSSQPLLKYQSYRSPEEKVFYGKVPLQLGPEESEVVLQEVEQVNLEKEKGVEAVLLLPPGPALPLVVSAHGGPHANAVSSRGSLSLLLQKGFAVLLVNFSGSLGYGQKGVDSLLGHIGTRDGE